MFTVLTFFWDVDNYNTVYMDIFAPFHFHPRFQGANLRLGEFNVMKNVSGNTTATGRIQDWAKPFATLKGENKTGQK